MKTKLLLGLFFSGISLFAQDKYTFHYRLDYEFPKTDYNPGYTFGKHYIPEKFTESTKNSILDLGSFYMMGFTFLDGNTSIQIQGSDLDNNFEIVGSGIEQYYGGADKVVEKLYDKIRLQKFEKEPMKVLDYTCNHYQLFVTRVGETQEEDARMIFCIDETNTIDNTSFIMPKQEGTNVKGLILAVTSPESSPGETIYLTKINKINSTIKFNLEKELAAHKVMKDSLERTYSDIIDNDAVIAVDSVAAVDYPYYNDFMNMPEFCNYTGFYELQFEGENSFSIGSTYMSNLCTYGYYLNKGEEEKFKKFALKEIKTIKKNYVKSGLMPRKDAEIFYNYLKKDIESLKKSNPKTAEQPATEDAVDAADAVYAVTEPDDSVYYETYVSEYASAYKTMKPEDSNFAVTSLSEDSDSNYWKGIPAYCKKLDASVPNFSDEELKKRAKNYAGQICDMYLGEFDGTGVWYKGTLDAIRSEQLYFNNNKDKLSKKDKELLDEFLNSLD